ncbi:Aste57867_21714 [Aphanomyces stellatus]|uniref:Aste57867_21714 protein n=1 Tax=Aphanomyces stellatus TaxID=120398 RepID=A0A485LN35_9STRA|nr:hypothetical protein As57867_021645 [Aphanomyces stellatus]VFT98383.1 Aste57867_21714 [Aphanomyces stellatus]
METIRQYGSIDNMRRSLNVPRWNWTWVAAMGALLWLHGVTVGMVFEGQKGLLNRFLWTFVIGGIPLVLVTQTTSHNIRRTAASLVYFELATFCMCYSNSLAWFRNPKNLLPLPDLGHDILPLWKDVTVYDTVYHHEAHKVPDVVMGLLISSTTVFALVHPLRWKIIQRFFIIYGSLCIMRSVTVICTSLPDSAEKCRQMTPLGNLQSGAHGWEDITMRAVLVRSLKLLIPIGEVTCGDMVFSGHSMLMVLCAMTWHTYYKWVPGSINYIKVSVWLITIFGLVTIVWVRMHYTLDVVLALYFTVTVWSSYHRIANDVKIGHRFSMVWIFDALFIYPCIEWIERPEDGHVSEPIPQPSPGRHSIDDDGDEDADVEDDDDDIVVVDEPRRATPRTRRANSAGEKAPRRRGVATRASTRRAPATH